MKMTIRSPIFLLKQFLHRTFCPGFLSLLLFLTGCGQKQSPKSITSISFQAVSDSHRIVLVPLEGNSPLDKEIARTQQQIQTATHATNEANVDTALERLGWLFVFKARTSFDPGFYKLAEQCALCIEQNHPGSPEAMLLRGHVLDSLHRFKEAEVLARRLTVRRGLGFDYGLLGDVLMEQGKLSDAVVAYQKMMDLKPDLVAYTRAAHMRWLKGDLAGAIEVMQLAVSAASPGDAESAAWAYTRLAAYEFQAGNFDGARQRCSVALSFQTNYPPALLLRGKLCLAENQPADAVAALETAAKSNPLPEYQWALAEALHVAGRENEALKVEAQLRQHAAASDPRTFALFLATRHESIDIALRLAREELSTRGDVFTHDALAWSLAAAGDLSEAQDEMKCALAEGTEDGRLFFHAAMIAAQAGDPADARRWREKAAALAQQLLPSERRELRLLAAGTRNPPANIAAGFTKDFSTSGN
jgi:tetratricopeptide (TPR) repeat protein